MTTSRPSGSHPSCAATTASHSPARPTSGPAGATAAGAAGADSGLGGLRERADAELAVEHAYAVAVLAQRLGPAPARRVEADQCPVGGLVQRIEGEAAAGVGDGVGGPAARLERVHEPVERPLELRPQLSGRIPLPVVEADAVAQPEPGQKVVAVKGGGRRQPVHGRRPVPGGCDQRPEPGDVHRVGLHLEHDGRPADRDPTPSERRSQSRQRAPERGPAAVGIRVGPEQVDQELPRLRAAGHREVGEDGHRLARVDVQRLAVDLDPRGSQHVDAKRHRAEYARA